MSIIIGGDIVPSSSNCDLFKDGDVLTLLGKDLLNYLNDVDYRVFNLETPLTNVINPIDKCGRALRADGSAIFGLKKMGVDLFTLANNHIMDQGNDGLVDTVDLLNENKINYLGAGYKLEQARQSIIVEVKGKKIGFYACVEHEFSFAGKEIPGANPFDALESFDHVFELHKKCDFVAVLYHGGKEHYRYPSPELQRVCRKFIQKGANLVICQHSHCIGSEEKYDNGTIVYGQGNFLFDDCKGPFVQSSLLVKLTDELSVEYVPLVKAENGVRLALNEAAGCILSEFKERSEKIKQKNFIEDEYKNFAKKMLKGYMLTCSGYSHKPFLRFLNKLSGNYLSKLFVNAYKKKELLAIRNYIECEAHRELFIKGLKND